MISHMNSGVGKIHITAEYMRYGSSNSPGNQLLQINKSSTNYLDAGVLKYVWSTMRTYIYKSMFTNYG